MSPNPWVVIPYQVRSYQTGLLPREIRDVDSRSRNPLSSQVISNVPPTGAKARSICGRRNPLSSQVISNRHEYNAFVEGLTS